MKYVSFLFLLLTVGVFAQDGTGEKSSSSVYNGLEFRNIGPAFSSGRIADVAINPKDDNNWYVAVGSGGVWKTVNAGVTWEPVFDDQSSYSIGCVTIDPNNSTTVWVGTGENVGGRHVAFGDGVYVSHDAGKSWKNTGLNNSEHISKIIVDPRNSDVVYAAAQGPLWTSGGERGLYKTMDGGDTWVQVLGGNEWTGVTDIAMDPEDPDCIYAATWQRHRTIAAFLGGGPGSGIHRSDDGGKNWQKLTSGIPGSNLGKIGLAISPFDHNVIYAAIELDRRTGGVYMSEDRGNSWTKQSATVSGATGPHYYQELYASPHHEGTLYLVDVRMQISDDHGKTFRTMKEVRKHSDNHSLAFRMDDPDYLLVGTDGGIYESFDLAENWRFIANLPVTQYYKVAVDDAEPFYNIFGGTQDNGTHGGPSRTVNAEGIRNADWAHILGGDGHQTATEPGNPGIVYGESQQGFLFRIDRVTGEQVFIQPQAGKDEPHERFNWDTPILVSAHDPARIYTASYRVWRSDNRGDSWKTISGDLTKDKERMKLPIMGRQQSWDNAWDIYAMSNFSTITSLGESPVKDGILYAGTDDGRIHVTTDGGENWKKIEVGSIKGIPATAFVNDIRADLFDANTVYAALDNHKYGDYTPYIIKSTDNGKSWALISGNIEDRSLVWRLVQDTKRKDMLFAATEFGVWFTLDGGKKWTKLEGGVPTISFRDIKIQRREDDLVAASFGRGFFILDDISPLRQVNDELLEKDAVVFPVKDAWLFQPKSQTVSPGADEYRAENPPFGAIFTYYLKEDIKSLKEIRKSKEKKLDKEEADIPFPGWEALEEEESEDAPFLVFTVRDAGGKIVNHVKAAAKKGFHRVNWDLRVASDRVIDPMSSAELDVESRGYLADPGEYSVKMYVVQRGDVEQLGEQVTFSIKELYDGVLEPVPQDVVDWFRKDLKETMMAYGTLRLDLRKAKNNVSAMKNACFRMDGDANALLERVYDAQRKVKGLEIRLSGLETKDEVGEKQETNITAWLSAARQGLATTYGPTLMHRESLELARDGIEEIQAELDALQKEVLDKLAEDIRAAGAPLADV